MNKALDAQCAALMGWHTGSGGAISGIAGVEDNAYWYDADGLRQAPRITDSFANMYQWSPTVSHEHARWLELKIERDGRPAQYVEALAEVVPHYRSDLQGAVVFPTMAIWAFLRATPEQRARAFVAAYTGELPQ